MTTDTKPRVDLSNLDRKLYPAIEAKTLPLAEYLEICGRVEHYDQMAAGTDPRTKALVEALLRIEGGGCVCAGDDHRDDCHVMVARAALALAKT